MPNTSITHLTDNALLKRTEDLTRRERRLTLSVIDHLMEVERRRLYAKQGHRSLFAYCTDELGYSGSAAGRRICAVRAIRRFPRVRRLLEDRRLTLSTLAVVSRSLGPESVEGVLDEVCGKTAREAEAVVARLRGAVRPRERIRTVAVARPVPVATQTKTPPEHQTVPGSARQQPVPAGPLARWPARGAPENHSRVGSKTAQAHEDKQNTKRRLTVERAYCFEFSGSEAFMAKYRQAVSLLSNRLGGRVTIEAVFEALLDDYIERNDPQRRAVRRERRARRKDGAAKEGATAENAEKKPKVRTSRRARHIPAATRDAVHVRDGRCTFVGESGKRCGATRHLQVDHVTPYARGGAHDAGNLRLLCATHNRLMAERAFGREHMAQFARRE